MTESPKAFVVAYEGALNDLTIPADVLARASAELDRERERRRLADETAQAAAEEAMRASGWPGWLRAMFPTVRNFRRGRGP
jgi:hypothetical protein